MDRERCSDHKTITDDISEIKRMLIKIYGFYKERLVVNGHIQQRVENIGSKSEEVDKEINGRVLNLEKAVVSLGQNDKNQDIRLNRIENLLYVVIGSIATFVITKILFPGLV